MMTRDKACSNLSESFPQSLALSILPSIDPLPVPCAYLQEPVPLDLLNIAWPQLGHFADAKLYLALAPVAVFAGGVLISTGHLVSRLSQLFCVIERVLCELVKMNEVR